MIDPQTRVHAGIKQRRVGCGPHDPVHHAQHQQQRQPGADQHQGGDDKIMHHRDVAVRHFNRPDQPAGYQQEQRRPMPDAGEAVADRRPYAGGAQRGPQPVADRPPVPHHQECDQHVQHQASRFLQGIVRNV